MPLTDSQIASWRFEDASNLGTDSVGANTLTNNNVATQAAGKVGRALALASASVQSLSVASNANLQLGGTAQLGGGAWTPAWEITCWVYPTALTTSRIILAKWDGVATEYQLYWESGTSKFTIAVHDVNSNSLVFWDTGVVATTLSTWYFLDTWYDPSQAGNSGAVFIGQNNGVATSTAFGGVKNSTRPFSIGTQSDGTSSPWSGRIDEVNIWKRLLTTAERTALYVGGARRRATSCVY